MASLLSTFLSADRDLHSNWHLKLHSLMRVQHVLLRWFVVQSAKSRRCSVSWSSYAKSHVTNSTILWRITYLCDFGFFKAIIFAVVYSSGRKRVWSSPRLDITLDGYVAYVTILRSYYRSYSNKRTVRLNFGIERLKIGNFCTIIHWDTFSHVAKILNGLGNLFDNHLPISLIW